MTEIKVELKADVTKVIALVDNEVITMEEGKTLLSQFKKEDLIMYALDDRDLNYDDEEEDNGNEEGEVIDLEEEDNKELDKEVEVITDEEDGDKPLTEEEDFENLLG